MLDLGRLADSMSSQSMLSTCGVWWMAPCGSAWLCPVAVLMCPIYRLLTTSWECLTSLDLEQTLTEAISIAIWNRDRVMVTITASWWVTNVSFLIHGEPLMSTVESTIRTDLVFRYLPVNNPYKPFSNRRSDPSTVPR